MSVPRKLLHDLKWQFHRIFDAWQDRRLAIDASGLINRDELASSGPNAKYSYVYLGTPHLVLSLAFRHLRIDPNRFTFVDLGSGKGRVVIRAAMRQFKRVEGVELSPKMHRVALENVDRARVHIARALRSPVIVRNEDVLAYDIPQTPLVLFFFNGFERVVLIKFVEKLERSLRDHPRECYFIYLNPRNEDCLEEHALMRKVPTSRLTRLMVRLLSPWPLAIYCSSSPAFG
jgi:SAM-dependent methyltransferase